MKIEIWSDVMCPFCYIGKRRFESALAQFPGREKVQVEWKSFQLNPGMKTEAGKSINEYLAEIKGWSIEQAKSMNDRVSAMAAAEGLKYDFDKAVVANSFDAHRLIQKAKSLGKGDLAEELLFRSYFTEGKNIADHAVLQQLGEALGIDGEEIKQLLAGDAYRADVEKDISDAQRVGVTGVPFFVFNRKYAVSGAQESRTFLEVLNKTVNDEL